VEGVEREVGRGGVGVVGVAPRLETAFPRPVGDPEGPSSDSGGVEEVCGYTEMCHVWPKP